MKKSLLLLALQLITPAHAEALDPLYDRIAEDLNAGRPLIIAGYYGLWHERAEDPERNLNWGTYYGHMRMLERVRKDKHARKNFRHWRWKRVFKRSQDAQPVRTLVYHQRVKPNAAWRKAGVKESFDAYLVMQAFTHQTAAGKAMTRHLRQASAPGLKLDDHLASGAGGLKGRTLALAEAQATGYFGHNFFYDYAGFDWDGLRRIEGSPERATGVFAVGCKTGRVPGFDELLGENVYALLYSKTLMAAEGYSTLALADGVLRRLDSKGMVKLGNASYRYFQKLGKPERRVGRPFVSQGHGLH